METWGEIQAGAKERIRLAARQLFLDKGFAATSAREISELSQVNIALIYYYYGSKKALFKYIVKDCFQEFEELFVPCGTDIYRMDDELKRFVDRAFELLTNQPCLPLFLLSSIKRDSKILNKTLYTSFLNSRLYSLVKENGSGVVPIHHLWNLMGLIVLPFISANVIKEAGLLTEKEFNSLLDERKKMIPGLIKILISR